ncbi:hypothetical protein HU200_019156 [Digitaria exilis]|uniref:Drought induced 19 protein type zinc-binding domain-containing protein n=1 Tax=Digitaria exilis TaxID=1010633 RepID=A0A835KHT4_9POAL|nr:hypothetical protein HU200_019156 [Digitaria exilis]
MDSEHWISRLAAAKRFYAAQLGHSGAATHSCFVLRVGLVSDRLTEVLFGLVGADRAGMDELDMDEEVRPEFACPYCYEDHDAASLCAHLEEEHPFEPHPAVSACPVCSEMVTRDMVNHITMQHGYLFKVLLGGGHRSSNNNNTTSISADPLLSSFGLSFRTSEAEQTSKSTVSCPDNATMVKETPAQARKLSHPLFPFWWHSIDSSLTREEREQKRKQASVRATFVQDLMLSTLFGE